MGGARGATRERSGLPAWPIVLVLASVAMTGALLATQHGSAIAPDSVTYISTARNLAHGRGLIDFTGAPLLVFAPGLSVLLAVCELVGIGILTGARTLNAVAFGLIVILSFILLRRHVRDQWLLLTATTLVAVSTPLLRIVGFVASDPLFLVVTLCFLLAMDQIHDEVVCSWPLVIGTAALVGAGFMLRYAGASLLVAGALTLAITPSRGQRRAALLRVVGFSSLALVVPIAWFLRNQHAAPGEPLGVRVQSAEGLRGIANDLVRGVVHLIVPDHVATSASLLLLLIVAAPIGIWAWASRGRLSPTIRARAGSVGPPATFVVVYLAFVTFAHKTTGSDLDPRILLPALIPVLVISAWFLDHLLAVNQRATLRWILSSIALVALLGSSVWFVRQVDAGASVMGYEATQPANVQMARDLRRIPHAALIVSNDPWRIDAVTGHQPVELAPIKLLPGSSHRPMNAATLTNAACRQPVVLVWFRWSPASGTRPIATFEHRVVTVTLTRLQAFSQGTIYRVESTEACVSPR